MAKELLGFEQVEIINMNFLYFYALNVENQLITVSTTGVTRKMHSVISSTILVAFEYVRSGFYILHFFFYATNCTTDMATGNTKVFYFHQLPFINSFNIKKLFHDQYMVENCRLDGTLTGFEATALPIASQPLLTKKVGLSQQLLHSFNKYSLVF